VFLRTTETDETIDDLLSTQLFMRYVQEIGDISNFIWGVQKITERRVGWRKPQLYKNTSHHTRNKWKWRCWDNINIRKNERDNANKRFQQIHEGVLVSS